MLLSSNLITWIDSQMQNHFKNLISRFHILKGGGVPILVQHVESSYEEHSPLHETPTTDDALSDVIDRIGRLNLDLVPTQLAE